MPSVSSFVPVSMRKYHRNWLPTDVIAGVTLAAVAIPETMGYTSISQTPIITGLYTDHLPDPLVRPARRLQLLVVGADSATAAIMAAGLASLRVAGLTPWSPEWVAFAAWWPWSAAGC